jgi:uncharacterized protein (DUF1330 family)
MAKAYIYAEIEITDPEEYEKYRAAVPATIEAFGGRYAVYRGEPEVLEGNRDVKRAVILEFESRERALAWYNSPQYAGAKAIRHRSAVTHVTLFTGNDVLSPIETAAQGGVPIAKPST